MSKETNLYATENGESGGGTDYGTTTGTLERSRPADVEFNGDKGARIWSVKTKMIQCLTHILFYLDLVAYVGKFGRRFVISLFFLCGSVDCNFRIFG